MTPKKSCYQYKYSNNTKSNVLTTRREETGIRYTECAVQRVLACACSLDKEKPLVKYAMNDMDSVYTHYDPKSGKNVQTPNKLKKGDTSDGTNGK